MYLYPIWIRLWHLFNAVLILVLIYTGISMQYTDRENMAIIAGFAKAVKWHNIAAVLLTFSYVFFVTGNIFTGNGKYYRIAKKDFLKNLGAQLRYYSFGMFRGEKHPFPVTLERKFNPLQKLSYVLAMYVAMPLLVVSGLGLLFPEIIINRFLGVSGLIFNDLLHVATGFLISVFLVIHVYTCTLGSTPGSLFRGIISGYHETEEH
jgi:thiosulfate reductase cytochrome b subunit